MFLAAIVLSHVTTLYSAALGSSPVHALEHGLYLWSGLLFWVVVRADPLPHRISAMGRLGLLLAAMMGMSALAAWLSYPDLPRYAEYAASGAELGQSAVWDQKEASAIMAVGCKFVFVPAILLFVMTGLWQEEQRQRRRDAYEARAARAECARALEVADNLITFGDKVDDLMVKSGRTRGRGRSTAALLPAISPPAG